MKNLVRFSIFISIHYLTTLLWIKESRAQDWPCGNPAATNTGVPNNNSTVYLSENSVAVHPLYPNIILSANNYNDYNINGNNRVSAYVSLDWGVTWYSPFPNGIFDNVNSCCDPAAAIGLNGYMYVAYLGNGIRVARSTDMGNTWPNIATLPTNGGQDKRHLKIDNSCNSLNIYKGRLYCAWSDNVGTRVSYSANFGIDWFTQTLPNSSGFGHNIATDNSGNVYMVWTGYYSWNLIKFTKSENGGITWSSPSIIDLQYTGYQYVGGEPSMTVNMQDNTLFLVYSGSTGGTYYEDVFMKKSTDGGTTWSGETRVNQVQTGHQTFPWISCDPMTGYLACIYYDTRNDFHTYLSISTNSGTSWCDMKISNIASLSQQNGIGNDYIGVEFNKGIVYPIWTDKRVNYDRYRTYTYPVEVILKDLVVNNPVLSGNQLIQSANTIRTSGSVTINSGANVTFGTVNSITLESGFYTNDNCVFTADVFHCQGYNEPENIVQNNQFKSKEKDNTIPLEFSLSQNYPNPFNPTTLIKYSLKQNSWVTIIIYNILGQEVKRLADRYENAGYSSIIWDGTDNYGSQVSSGIYFCRLTAGDYIDQKKMVVIR